MEEVEGEDSLMGEKGLGGRVLGNPTLYHMRDFLHGLKKRFSNILKHFLKRQILMCLQNKCPPFGWVLTSSERPEWRSFQGRK